MNQTKIDSMITQLNKEIASSTTPLQKKQYAIQKSWLKQKIGHLEILLYPGKLWTNAMTLILTDELLCLI